MAQERLRRINRAIEEQDERDRLREAAGPMVHVCTHQIVHSYSQVFAFMRLSMQIYRAARAAPGFVAGGLKTRWWRKEFWTYTVWTDPESMRDFIRSEPHASAVARVREFVVPGAPYAEWISQEQADMAEALERLKSPTGFLLR
jgi:heme-degrading monooxygenase HmoA